MGFSDETHDMMTIIDEVGNWYHLDRSLQHSSLGSVTWPLYSCHFPCLPLTNVFTSVGFVYSVLDFPFWFLLFCPLFFPFLNCFGDLYINKWDTTPQKNNCLTIFFKRKVNILNKKKKYNDPRNIGFDSRKLKREYIMINQSKWI